MVIPPVGAFIKAQFVRNVAVRPGCGLSKAWTTRDGQH
jgi:hypothetical protein